MAPSDRQGNLVENLSDTCSLTYMYVFPEIMTVARIGSDRLPDSSGACKALLAPRKLLCRAVY